MRQSHILQALLMAATASAGSGDFYVNIDGKLEPLTTVASVEFNILTKDSLISSSLSQFDWTDNLVSTEFEGKQQTLGLVNDYLVFGPRNLVSPTEVALDASSKITSLTPYLCKTKHAQTLPVLMNRNSTSESMDCKLVELYFKLEEEIRKAFDPNTELKKDHNKTQLPDASKNQSDVARGNSPNSDIFKGKPLNADISKGKPSNADISKVNSVQKSPQNSNADPVPMGPDPVPTGLGSGTLGAKGVPKDLNRMPRFTLEQVSMKSKQVTTKNASNPIFVNNSKLVDLSPKHPIAENPNLNHTANNNLWHLCDRDHNPANTSNSFIVGVGEGNEN